MEWKLFDEQSRPFGRGSPLAGELNGMETDYLSLVTCFLSRSSPLAGELNGMETIRCRSLEQRMPSYLPTRWGTQWNGNVWLPE